MKLKDFAPHLAGRMLPGLFSCDLKIGQRERFPGDPWPHFPPSPQLHWMHSSACVADERGCTHGLCFSKRLPAGCRDTQHLEPTSQQVLKAERASADATAREFSVYRSPGVGPMGARQPADAGPQRELFAEIAS